MLQSSHMKKGFTLIELLVTIVIIGILATISVTTFQNFAVKARDAKKQAFLRIAGDALKPLYAKNRHRNYWFHTESNQDSDTIRIEQDLKTYFEEHDITVPKPHDNKCFVFGHERVHKKDFFMAVESEENPGTFFITGTIDGVTVINSYDPLTPAQTVSNTGCKNAFLALGCGGGWGNPDDLLVVSEGNQRYGCLFAITAD